MPKYMVESYVTATVLETWEIEAEDEDAAYDALWMGEGEHISDVVLGNETDREIRSIKELTR